MPRIVNLANYPSFQAINLLVDPGADPGKIKIPNGCRFIISWNLTDGKQAHNVLGMAVSAGFTPTAVLAEQARVALTSGTNWTGLAGFLAPGTQLTAVTLRDLRDFDLPLVPSTGAPVSGTSAGTALPSEVAAVITLRTAKVGPGNRGRVYIPGWATNAIGTGDTIAAGAVTALNFFCTNISNAISSIGGDWSLTQPHRLAYTSPKTGVDFDERQPNMAHITSATTRDNHWDSQRRRGLK